jgi:hypothetical protein
MPRDDAGGLEYRRSDYVAVSEKPPHGPVRQEPAVELEDAAAGTAVSFDNDRSSLLIHQRIPTRHTRQPQH